MRERPPAGFMSNYVPRLPNYTNNLRALGWQDAEFADGGSDRLVDANRGVG